MNNHKLARRTLRVLMALALVVPLFAYLAPGKAAAASVSPIELVFNGNATCSEFAQEYGQGQTWVELKVDPNADGQYTDGTLTVTISNTVGDKSFDWSSNIGVDAVFVKAGGDHNLYVYDPPGPEATSDTDLSSPGATGNGISHISFCYDAGDGTTTTTTTSTPTTTTTTTTPTTTSTTSTTSTTTTSTTQPEATTSTTSTTTTSTTRPEATTSTTQREATTSTTATKTSVEATVVTRETTSTTAAVQGTTETLPFTGSSSTGLGGVGVALLMLGGLVLLAFRKQEDPVVETDFARRIDNYRV